MCLHITAAARFTREEIMATSNAHATLPSVSAEQSAIFSTIAESAAIAEVEMKKLLRDPTELFTRAVQPTLWLVVFGQVFSRVRGIPTGNVSFLAFMTPGILAQSVLFAAIFYGIAVIWERDLGIIHKLLVSPAHRVSFVLGKAISAGARGLIQGLIVVFMALVMGVRVRTDPAGLLGITAGVF